MKLITVALYSGLQVAGNAFTGLALACGQERIESRCGYAVVPSVPEVEGVICTSLCAERLARNGCVVAGTPATVPAEQNPVPSATSITFLIRGSGVSLAAFAEELHRVSGWRGEVRGDIGACTLLPQGWRGRWNESERVSLKTANCGRVALLADEPHEALVFAAIR
jgi:hypothetical protein